VPYSCVYTLPEPIVVAAWKNAHTFKGWYTDEKYTDAVETIEMKEDVSGALPPMDFYALWGSGK